MNEDPTAVGVIGVGSMGRHHARVYNELSDANLVGVADHDVDRAREIAREYDTTARETEDLLETADAVTIAVPTQFHYDTASQAIEHGVDVLVEKPLVANYENGERLREQARRNGAIVQVGHIERFNPAIQTMLDVAADLDVIAVDARRLGPPLDRNLDDSAVFDLMIHDIDVLLALVDGEIESISAKGAADNRYIAANLTFECGIVATLTASRVTEQKIRDIAITADGCRVNVDYLDQSVDLHRHSVPDFIDDDGGLRYRHESIIERPMVDNGEPLKAELSAFLDAVRTGNSPPVTVDDGLRALEIAREIDTLAAQDRHSAEVPSK